MARAVDGTDVEEESSVRRGVVCPDAMERWARPIVEEEPVRRVTVDDDGGGGGVAADSGEQRLCG